MADEEEMTRWNRRTFGLLAWLASLSVLRLSAQGVNANMGLDVRAFGARGDGVTDDSPAFARAIRAAGDLSAACASCGSGGRVIVPATATNVYLLGTAGAMASDAVLTPYG